MEKTIFNKELHGKIINDLYTSILSFEFHNDEVHKKELEKLQSLLEQMNKCGYKIEGLDDVSLDDISRFIVLEKVKQKYTIHLFQVKNDFYDELKLYSLNLGMRNSNLQFHNESFENGNRILRFIYDDKEKIIEIFKGSDSENVKCSLNSMEFIEHCEKCGVISEENVINGDKLMKCSYDDFINLYVEPLYNKVKEIFEI